jgi:hypothetical protein
VKIGTYYRGFKRAYCLHKLKKVRVREGELKIKLEKERMRGTERKTKNLKEKKNTLKKKLERERNCKEEGKEE